MKTILTNILFAFCVLGVSLPSVKVQAQKIHVDYKQTVGTTNTFEVEVWVTNLSDEPCKLSALNTVFGYLEGMDDNVEISFVLAKDFVSMAEPVYSVIPQKMILRATQTPVLNSEFAIPLSKKPQLFATLKVKSNTYLRYPIRLTPSTKGNPTVQSIVYTGNTINSTALTLVGMTITTDENPLILKLMGQPVAHNFAEGDVEIYPNPASNIVYFESRDLSLKDWKFQIYNQVGALVYASSQNDILQKYVDVSAYPAGTYFIHIIQDELVTRKKLVKVN